MEDIKEANDKKELKTIEIEQSNNESTLVPPPSAGKTAIESHANFGNDTSGEEEDEASEVDSFILDENDLESEQGLEGSKFLLAAESDSQGIQTVDPQTQARLEALLEAAGISKLSSKDGKALSDPEVLRTLTSSVSSALDEAAQALHRMRDSQGQLLSADGVQLDAGENDSLVHRSNSGNAADATEEGESLLSLACSAGYYELAQVLLAMKANVEDRGIKGDCTPLMEAASGGHVDIVRLLLLHNADVNAQSSAGNTPLHYGACGGFKEVVQELLLHGANVEIHNENGHTPLMEAASAGHVDVAKILLEHGAGINTHSNEFKESALTLACYKGHLEMVKFLLEAGADQEHKTDEMHTALMEASMDGHVEVARLLLDSGAQVNMPADSFESPLTLAACGGHLELASLLIERGANIEEVNDEGYTPLMEAAREGHEDMVALLLSNDADINAQTEETQETALTLACCGGFLEVADFLLRSGALIELGCSTPLMEAAQEGHLELVSFLLQSGANVDAQTGTGDTALTYACENGHTDVAEALLECGAKLEHESEGGRTPLMKAARAGHLCTVQFLISRGADVNRATTSNDHTVLSLACAGGHLNVVELLLQNGAHIGHRLKDGSTMVIEAAKGGHTPVVKLLLEWPNKCIYNCTAEHLAQLSISEPQLEEPRVPVQGLANIVPPSEPDSQAPSAVSNLNLAIQGKNSELIRQNITKAIPKRTNVGQTEGKNGSKLCNAVVPDYSQYFSNTGLMEDKIIDKDEKMSAYQEDVWTTENIRLEQENSQCQLLYGPDIDLQNNFIQAFPETPSSVKQTEEISKLFELPSQTLGISEPLNLEDFTKLFSYNEMNTSPAACHEQFLPAHLQHQQNVLLQQSSPPPPPSPTLSVENRAKNQGSKRNGSSKTVARNVKSSPVTPPPPPPPPQGVTPFFSQVLLAQAQPIVFQSEHNGAPQNVDLAHMVASTSQVPSQQLSALQHLKYPNQEQFLQQMQQLQHISQQSNETSDQSTSSSPAHLSQQQHQMLHQQQQHAQYLQQQLQQLKSPGNQTNVAKSQIRKQQRVAQNLNQATINAEGTVSQVPVTPCQHVANGNTLCSIDVDSQTDSNHDTALTLGCAGGHSDMIVFLLGKGANIEHRDKKGFTPLILAATAGHVEVVEVLLEHGADIEAQSERTKDTPLSLACSGGRYEVVELLLNRGANKEHRNVSDYTPLSLAASGGYVNIIKLLLSHNAEINSRTGSKLGISPLMLAAMNGHTAAVKLLLDMGSDINAQIETNRNTALTLACFQGRHEVVSLLVDRKANIEHRAKTGLTPLMEAASGGYVEVGRVLLDKHADVNAPPVPSSRDTALTIAADKGHYRFVELLLHRGAAVDVKNKKGNSPLWLACNGGHSDVVSLLVQADADIDSQDNRKVSCLMAAFRRGHIKVVKWMVKKVTQFPSENEIKRYIATITDKELQKKCNQCAEIIVTAKERQAAEANKNAASLLEEIKQEKEQAALKAELASKRRERRRERKRKGKQKEEKNDSGKNSSPEPDGDVTCKKDEEEEEEEEEEDDSNSEPAVTSAVMSGKTNTVTGIVQQPCENVSRLPLNLTREAPLSPSMASDGLTMAAAARANREARKKHMKAARENRRETSERNSGLNHVKAEISKKQVNQALQVTIAKITTLIDSVVTASTIACQASSNSVTVTSSLGPGVLISSSTKSAMSTFHSNPPSLISGSDSNNKDVSNLNGGVNKARSKKSNSDIIKQSCTTGIGDLDDFGVIPTNVLKTFEKNGKNISIKKLNDTKKDWIEDYRYYEKNVNNRLASASNARKGQKKDEGWKEVVRKNMSKKLSVPANVISRLIGKGGCNINAIRDASGAHVEVEKSKGNSARTVTMKGSAEAIKQANNLINAMVDEPDKEIADLIARLTKVQKSSPVEKPQKTTVSIADFAIGTFTLPTTVSSIVTNTNTKSPSQAKSNRQSANQSGRSSNSSASSIGPTIGAWQNPVPGQNILSSPRRSPQKQMTPNTSTPGARVSSATVGDKSSARQHLFSERKRSASPVSLATSSSTCVTLTTSTSSVRSVVSSSTIMPSQIYTKSQDSRMQAPIKTAVGSPTISHRFPRPVTVQNRTEPLPLPIVSGNNSNSGGSQSSVGEYSPFNNSLFTNFLTKKEEPLDKMDFASVAAAGVVTTTPSPQTSSVPTSVITNTHNAVDPALQAKAPGFKIPVRNNSPPYRPELPEPASYRSMNQYVNMPGALRHGAPQFPYYDMYLQPQTMYRGDAPIMQPFLMGTGGMPMHHGVYAHGIPLPQQSAQPKDEYSKPHRPMTLPEIKGALNPNAPEFQLSNSGPQLTNGFERSPANISGVMGMTMVEGRALPDVSVPNPGVGLPNISGTPMMTPEMMHYLLQASLAAGGSPPQLTANRLGSVISSNPLSHNSPPQGLIGQPGLPPAGFLAQPQPTQSPLSGRPSSAPSLPQEAGPRSSSPMSSRNNVEQMKSIQPIGGERKKGSGRPLAYPNNVWSVNNPGNNMGYQRMADTDDDYGMQSPVQYNDAAVIPGNDGDHVSNMVYNNGPYHVAPMFPPKGAAGDSQGPLWNAAMTSSDRNDMENWQSWSQ